MNEQLKEVRKFHTVFEHPIGEEIKALTVARGKARAAWMEEEVKEFVEALEDSDTVGQIDAMVDLIYFALGTLVEIGVTDVESFFNIVQQANMAKVWPDGKVHKRTDGKTIKPADWTAPDALLKAELNRQFNSNCLENLKKFNSIAEEEAHPMKIKSCCVEEDGKVYYYDDRTKTWITTFPKKANISSFNLKAETEKFQPGLVFGAQVLTDPTIEATEVIPPQAG